MDWKARFPVGLFLLAALMLAGGVSAATSMKVAATNRTTVALVSESDSEHPSGADESETSEPREDSEPAEGEGQSRHGGSVARFHESCELPAGAAALEENWTHGDYVSAYAKGADREAHVVAAHSPCGKPMKSVEKNNKDNKDRKDKHGKSHGQAGKRGQSKNHNA
jgi:hypothetical protein